MCTSLANVLRKLPGRPFAGGVESGIIRSRRREANSPRRILQGNPLPKIVIRRYKWRIMNAKSQSESRVGYYGPYGGKFVPETLMAALEQLDHEYHAAMADEGFRAELDRCYREIAGRPSELYFCRRLSEQLGGAKI